MLHAPRGKQTKKTTPNPKPLTHQISQYCDYSGTTKKCKKWLNDEHPDVFARLYPDEDLSKELEEKATLKEGEGAAEEGEKKKPKGTLSRQNGLIVMEEWKIDEFDTKQYKKQKPKRSEERKPRRT